MVTPTAVARYAATIRPASATPYRAKATMMNGTPSRVAPTVRRDPAVAAWLAEPSRRIAASGPILGSSEMATANTAASRAGIHHGANRRRVTASRSATWMGTATPRA